GGRLPLGHDALGVAGMLLQPGGELLVDRRLDERADGRVAELGLGLPFELRVAELDRDDGNQALANVLPLEVLVLLLEQALLPGVPFSTLVMAFLRPSSCIPP